LLELITFCGNISSFMDSHLSLKIVLSISIFLHFSNTVYVFRCSSLHRGYIPFSTPLLTRLNFHIPIQSHAYPTLALKLHRSIHSSLLHFCFIFQYDTIDLLSFILSLLDYLWTSLQLVHIIRHYIYTSAYTHACGCCVLSAHFAATAAQGGSTTHPTLAMSLCKYVYVRAVCVQACAGQCFFKEMTGLTDFCVTDMSWRLFHSRNFRIAAINRINMTMEDRWHQFIKCRNQMNHCVIFCITESSTDSNQTSHAHVQWPFYNALCHLFNTRIQRTQQKILNRSNWWRVF
jgi:hypothetical protein